MIKELMKMPLKNVTIKWDCQWEGYDGVKGSYVPLQATYNNVRALAIFPAYSYNENTKKNVLYGNLTFVGLSDITGNYSYNTIFYMKDFLNNEKKPTLADFTTFFGDSGYSGDGKIKTINEKVEGVDVGYKYTDNIITIKGDCPVFLANDLGSVFTIFNSSGNNVRDNYVIENDGDVYLYNNYIATQYNANVQGFDNAKFQQLAINNKFVRSHFVHTFYVNGGILGKNSNYSVTEVITTIEGNPVKWVNDRKSKLYCYKYDSAYDIDDNWECPLNANKLDVTRDSAFSTIMAKNSVSSIQQNVAFINKQTPFFSYRLIPTFIKEGSVFTGTQYTMEFPAYLPSDIESVNNTWANVKIIANDVTDANNEVIVKYGEPPISQTPDEKILNDDDALSDNSQDNGEGGNDSASKDPSYADIIYGDMAGSSSVLTKLYAISDAQLNLLGENLWSQKYFDVLRIQDNPIENIISIKRFPFTINGIEESIKIGNVDLGVNADRISNGVYKMHFGDVKIGGKYGNFLDFEPFTTLKICLPYIGFHDLPISELMNQLIGVDYLMDLIHGDCTAIIKRNTYPLYEFNGVMGVNVPLTQTDRVSAETKHINNVLGGAVRGFTSGGIAGGLVGLGESMIESGLSNYNSTHTASGSGALNFANVQNIRLIYNRPSTITKNFVPYPNRYRHTHGLPYNNAIKIDDLSGFFKCGNNIDLSSIQATKEIKDLIISLLQGGVYK